MPRGAQHSFTVPVGVDDAWKVLLDIERVAPCMPGAALDTVDGDDFTGTVKVKLGPIGLTYKGKASFVEKDEAAHRAVIDARRAGRTRQRHRRRQGDRDPAPSRPAGPRSTSSPNWTSPASRPSSAAA